MKRMRVALLVWVPVLALSVALVGCSDKKDGGGSDSKKAGGGDSKKAGGGDSKKGLTAVMPGKGTLKGKITFVGDKPDLAALTAGIQKQMKDKDADMCLSEDAKKAGDADQQEWKIDASGGVKDVFVWLRPAQGTFFAADETNPKVMDVKGKELLIHQPHCAFHPHAAFAFPYYYNAKHEEVPTGQKIVIKNDSPKQHNTNLGDPDSENPKANFLLAAGETKEYQSPKVDKQPIHVACNIHGYMNADLWVVDSPYFAVTKPDGTFEIKDVPEGNVQLVVWHAGAKFVTKGGYKGEPIELKSGENTKDMTIKAK